MWTSPDAGLPLAAADAQALDLALWRLVDTAQRLEGLGARADGLADACRWQSEAFTAFRARVQRWGEGVAAAAAAVRAAEDDLRTARWRMLAAGAGGE